MKVTIGLPAYNSAKYVANAIASIKSQTFTDWECIVIDDGSNDATLETIMSSIDERFRVIADGENIGLIRRLNQIIDVSSGIYIARMDSDDIMHPERIQRQVSVLEKKPEIDIIGSSAYLIDDKDFIYGVRDVRNDFSRTRFLSGSPFIHPSITGRRKWFIKNKYDPSADRIEDYELWLRTFSNSCFANIEEPLLFYREAGLPYLQKYLASSRGKRRILKRNLMKDVRKFDVIKSISISKSKDFIFTLLSYLGREDEFMMSRARKLDALQYMEASMNLRKAVKDV